ncbi:MAG: hypothetical protein IPM56_18835 [Ignavibacteriales bacterium]|nr:MAG: hypothetical protein IPM56_18835 [Ignavibacteriales bacterium]
MGGIIYWALIRTAIVIPLLWFLTGYIDYRFWWIIFCFLVYGVIIHPAIVRYRSFEEQNKQIVEASLCSSCRHFDKSAVLCMKYDKHPSVDFLPCDGKDWEPGSEHGVLTDSD